MSSASVVQDPFAVGKANAESSAGSKVGGGRYRLIRILGRGGMGIVWLAHDERLNCEVALKFLPPQIRHDPVALDELRRETSRSRQLTHPHIVRIHDVYEAPGDEDAFISMEYVDGRNLAELRVEQPSRVFSWFFLKPLVMQLCSALEYAHGERIIHRDLKPGNLMFDSKRRLKLADFGIARAVSETMTRMAITQTSGTLLYMSPQQLEGGISHPTDDIYSLGAILYDLLTGKPPFHTGDITHQVRTTPPRPMQKRLEEFQITNDIPHGIEQVIMACLSKEVAQRPQSAAEVGRMLDGDRLRLVDTQPRVESPTTTSRVRAPARKSKNIWWWALAGGLACGIVVWATARNVQVAARTRETPPVPVTAIESAPVPTTTASGTVVPPVSPPEVAAVAVSPNPAPPAHVAPKEQPVPTIAVVKPVGQGPPDSKPAPEVPAPTMVAKVEPAPVVASIEPRPPAPTPAVVEVEMNAVPAVTLNKATALQLLQKGNSHVSSRSQNKVLQIVSGRAPIDEPPQSWRISYFDEKANSKTVEVRFEAGEMERVSEPGALRGLFSFGSSKTLDLDKVRIDSDQAIRIAAAQCEADEGTPRFVELKLERGYGGLPVWNVRLFGTVPGKSATDATLGSVILLAEDGKVLKKDIASRSEKPASRK